jgi:voltage-gated potassium channel Kch
VSPWELVTLIWANRFPSEKPRDRTLIEKLISTVTILIFTLSLSQLKEVIRKRSLRASHIFMDLYVIVWFMVLVALLGWGNKINAWILLAIAAYRIIDIVNYRILFLFLKSEEKPWTATVIRRSLAIVLTNFLELVIAFAIIYMNTETIKETTTGAWLSRPTEALYFSLVTMTTVGFGDFVPVTALGRWLAMAQLLCTLIFVLFLVPALISVFSDRG